MIAAGIICMCVIGLLVLCGLAGLICLIGTRTDSMPTVMSVIILVFFAAYVVISFMFGLIDDAYDLPMLQWQSGG